jgi:hypothetical protein
MNRSIGPFLLFALILSIVLSGCGGGNGGNGNGSVVKWQTVGSEGFSDGRADFISLAFDSIGIPYVAYQAENGKVTVKKFDGEKWVDLGEVGATNMDPNTRNYQNVISLAFDNQDNLYVAFSDSPNGKKANLKMFNGSGWDTKDNYASEGAVGNISLAFDNDNIAYVAYEDQDNGSKITVKKRDGGTVWSYLGNGFSDGFVGYISMKFDKKTNTPYVAYTDFGDVSDNNYAGAPKVKKYNAGLWEDVGVNILDSSEDETDNIGTSLAFNSDGAPYLGYCDWDDGKARVKKWDGSNWANVGGVLPGNWTSLAFDKNNNPHLLHGTAYVSKFNGSSWETLGNGRISTDNISYSYLAFDCNNTPYVAYQNNSTYKITVKKYVP